MITHELKIGQRIFDIHDKRWGTILLIAGKDENKILHNEDCCNVILIKPDDSYGECEITADECYPIVEDRYFWGENVCLEINKDGFDEEHDFDFYCPERNENCWEFEVA